MTKQSRSYKKKYYLKISGLPHSPANSFAMTVGKIFFILNFKFIIMASQEEKKQKILIVILVVSVLAAAVVFVWNFSDSKTVSMPAETISETIDESFPYLNEENGSLPSEELVSTELDLKVLESMQFKDLRSHGDLPVKADQTGRSNPFLPY